MALNNPWVTYITRSYSDIKAELLAKLPIVTPELTDHSDSNILVIIIDIFAGIAEMMNYYIDNMAREAFVTTARRYSSMVKHAALIDYRIKASIPSTVDILVQFLDAGQDPLAAPGNFTIAKGAQFSTENGVEFVTVENIDVLAGSESVILPVRQMTESLAVILGVTTPDIDQTFAIGTTYAHDTIDLKVGAETWYLKSTLGRSGPADKHYIVEISSDKVAYVKFGDGVNGAIPTSANNVTADYFTTQGSLGNVNAATIINTSYNFAAHSIPNTDVTNTLAAVAGTDYEDIERIRRSAPLSLRTLDRAVTKQDYIDVARLAPGVDKCNIDFDCGKTINLYITPNGGGIAANDLLDTTNDYVSLRKMITTFVNILPAGESYIYVKINAKARFRASALLATQDILTELSEQYSYETSDVNKPVRTSDIIALVDNLDKIDYLTLEYIYLIPYMRPTTSSTVELIKDMSINEGSSGKLNWKIQFDGTYMRLFKEGKNIANNISVGSEYTDPANILTMTINPSAYTAGMEWTFVTYAYNQDIELDDYTIPIIDTNNLNINVEETLTL